MIHLTGGEAVVRMLEQLGVTHSFGMAGFQHLPYYEAIRNSKKVKHVLIRNEQAGAFMADAFARAGGKVAVCDATAGPGATNLVTGLAESFYAGVPVLAITSSVIRSFVGRGANQECDQINVLRPVVKESVYVNFIERIPELMKKAFRIAVEGRPGPVHIDIPEDIFHGEADFDEKAFEVDIPSNTFPLSRITPEQRDIDAACALLKQAESPVILAGGGIHNSGAWEELRLLAEKLAIPVATTISGKGSIPEKHPLSLNVCGRYFRFANEFVKKADVLLVVGCRLGEMSTVRWSLVTEGTKIVRIDIDQKALGMGYNADVALLGDAKATLSLIRQALKRAEAADKDYKEKAALIAETKAKWALSVSDKTDDTSSPINIAHMLKILQGILPEDAIMVGDGGFSAHWSSVYWDVNSADGRHYLANRGQAAIGYGLPAALGCKFACPEKTVVALSGDGGLGYSFMELETAVREKKNVILIVVNNRALGYIKALQHAVYGEYISTDFEDVRYGEMASLLGCYGVRVSDPSKLEAEFKAALERKDRPTVIEVMVTTDPAKMFPGTDNRVRKK
ncbi:MAG: thiamine pyrophosphate-binding protein [Ruminococcaceae bacterium]|nr:thiamine pyrophosphate-binding protein [Oscillospiraceae bacterium]